MPKLQEILISNRPFLNAVRSVWTNKSKRARFKNQTAFFNFSFAHVLAIFSIKKYQREEESPKSKKYEIYLELCIVPFLYGIFHKNELNITKIYLCAWFYEEDKKSVCDFQFEF